jgi:hypothetical protein
MPKSTARRRSILILALAGAIAAHAGSILHSQDTTTPTFRTDANYVRVDVYETRDGKPVADLTADAMRASATRAALDALTAATRDLPARANVVVSRGASAGMAPRFTVVAQPANGAAAGRVEVTIATPDGETVATGRAPLAGGTASLEIASQPPASPAASYIVRIRIESGGLSETLTQAVTVRPTTGGSGALYFRRRGAQESATADLRFRRAETLRLEIPSRADAGARLLDRTGAAINVPVESGSRVEEDGSQWTTVRPPLASLAPGDYLIEITHGSEQVLLPFRMVP